MEALILTHLEYMLRILLSALCGLALGVERKNQLKEAGVRTHLIVALGAALIMVVSKYGFFDLMGNDLVKLDPSRIAAQIVSGVGFLGAGMIFMRNQSITGLTTAAGIWATAGIGMSMGAGLYGVALFSTALVLVTQIVLGRWEDRLLHHTGQHALFFRLRAHTDIAPIMAILEELDVKVLNLALSYEKNDTSTLDLTLTCPKGVEPCGIVQHLQALPEIEEIRVLH